MQITCINCPMGCVLEVKKENEQYTVTGNQCKRGVTYAINECSTPMRMVTTSLYIRNSHNPVMPVKTSTAIPKDKIFKVLLSLKEVECTAPIHIGEVIVENILGLGVDIVATKQMNALNE